MATIVPERASARTAYELASSLVRKKPHGGFFRCSFRIRACHSVDNNKDIYKQIEEAQLIKQLADMNVVDYRLYKQAYDASIDVGNFLDQYEMSKLLKGPFDMAGACLVIKAEPSGIYGKTSSATVDVVPMLLENAHDLEIGSEDLIISSPSINGEQ